MGVLDLLNLKDKVALVTGGSRGIGRAIAEGLAEAGAKVMICSRKPPSVEEATAALQKKGCDVQGVVADIGDPEQAKLAVDHTVKIYGGIDIVINNAATNPHFGPVVSTETWAFDKIINVNLRGPFLVCQRAYPELIKRGGGTVVNISSVEGLSPGRFLGMYSVSKAALNMMTRVMANEWGGDNIRVNAICPGLIKTSFSKALWQNEDIVKHVLSNQPIQRVGEAHEVAGLALFLASPLSSYVTGAVYAVDGGYTS